MDRIQSHGFKGPFALEIAKFALIRQIIEDGVSRTHAKSIVGMSVGGVNGKAFEDLGLTLGSVNSDGISLKKCHDANGQSMYALYGPRANIWSAAAICILWDKYINQAFPGSFTAEEREGWNVCKEVSAKIADGKGQEADQQRYREEIEPAKKALSKANAIYSSTAAYTISKIVTDMEPLFEFVGSRQY